jgi:DNA topoisomerase-1
MHRAEVNYWTLYEGIMSAANKLVIVESKTKADTIKKYLGAGYTVIASVGHIRDLPATADDIPEQYKGESWARLGVNIEDGFKPIYIVSPEKKKVVAELKKALKNADELFVATDEDREGEAIGWHLVQVLKPKVPTHRMVFHEITPEAIRAALENTREIDVALVDAQETRRILDRLVGYVVSPLLWKKVKTGLSAGRVQSVAVRLIVLRERERMRFRSGTYWDIAAKIGSLPPFSAQLSVLAGERLATGRDFDETTGQIIDGRNVLLLGEDRARTLTSSLKNAPFTVSDVESRAAKRSPYPPFTTSSLQQEANRKLGFTADRTMKVAQGLYENGLITYMRTDSVSLSEQAIAAARGEITGRYGANYLHSSDRKFTNKSKGAQEAHEAVRPSGTEMKTAEELRLRGDDEKLYDLIWKRTIATQMADAQLKFTTVTLSATCPESGDLAEFKSSGREVVFPGFLRAYVEGSDDPDEALDDQNRPLPSLTKGENVTCDELEPAAHETKPPARYTEATLVKALESEGIGRPSTYASIIRTIQSRNYVFTNKSRQMVPTFTAMAVTGLLEQTHPQIVDLEFTAAMEERLDAIAQGGKMEGYLDTFYHEQVEGGVTRGNELDARTVCTIQHDGIAPYVVRVGRYGPFVEVPREDGTSISVSLPDDVAPADVTRESIEKLAAQAAKGDEPLGVDPETGMDVFVLVGRFGPYVQLGDGGDKTTKPKRSSLPKGTTTESVDLELALKLLELPRLVGMHPESGEEIRAGLGQYGPYVKQGKTYASLTASDDVLTVGLSRALELFELKATRGSGRTAAAPLRELGNHPEDDAPIVIMDGRYGPYLKHGKTNATLPKGIEIEKVTMAEAVELIAAKAAKGGTTSKRKPAAKASTTKASTTKASTTKAKAPVKAKAPAKSKAKTTTKAKSTTTRGAGSKSA